MSRLALQDIFGQVRVLVSQIPYLISRRTSQIKADRASSIPLERILEPLRKIHICLEALNECNVVDSRNCIHLHRIYVAWSDWDYAQSRACCEALVHVESNLESAGRSL